MRKILLLIFISLFLFSCDKEGFSVESIGLKNDIEIRVSGDSFLRHERMVLSCFAEGSDDESYTYMITSPDSDLTWSGALGEEGFDFLEINPGAEFPSGIYRVIIYSTAGTDVEEEIEYEHPEDEFSYFSDNFLTSSAYVREYGRSGNLIEEGRRSRMYEPCTESAYAVIESRGHRVVQDLIGSPDEGSEFLFADNRYEGSSVRAAGLIESEDLS